MARIGYVSRSAAGHDEQWRVTLEYAGHVVVPLPASDGPAGLRAAAEQDDLELFVAGPLTDAAVAAVDANVLPTIGISWAFDLLVDLNDPLHGPALQRALPRLAALHVDSSTLADIASGLGIP